MSRFALTAFALVLGLPSVSSAQNISRLGRAVDASKPRTDSADDARRRAQNQAALQERVQDVVGQDRLLRMPQGYYTLAPDKYRPDQWSPRIRARCDVGPGAVGARPRGFRYSHRYDGAFRNNNHRFGRGLSYGGTGLCYGDGYRDDGYFGGGWGVPPEALEDAYVQGRYDADHEYQDYIASERAGRLLDANRLGVSAGLEYFVAGHYDRAAIEWLGASERNHGDAASRVYAGHALFAVGRYDEAVKLLARAFELAPFLTESYYDIRAEYGNPLAFSSHLATLKAYVAGHPDSASAVTLLGYVISYSEGPAAANPILERAGKLCPSDFFVLRLLKVSRMVTPMPGVAASRDGVGRPLPGIHDGVPPASSQPEGPAASPARQTPEKAPMATIHRVVQRTAR